MMKRAALVALVMLIAAVHAAAAEEVIATLTLDGLSYVSFGDRESLPLSGSTMKLHFGTPSSDGTVPFRIDPGDVSIAPITISTGQTLQYSISAPASGSMRRTPNGRRLDFTATVTATLTGGTNQGTYTYTIPFTTEQASASNHERTKSVSVAGLRVAEGAWYTQLVGATTNRENAFPEPGSAVYAVLSGSFDRMP